MSDENYQDLVSIIMPTYNSERYVGNSIESIIAQSYKNWELLITDDCSTDSTYSLVSNFIEKDSRIKLFRLEKNSGGGVARSYSIKNAHGRYLAFCDSDDLWLPTKLECQLAFMKEKRCCLSYSSYLTCEENGSITGIVIANSTTNYKQESIDNRIGCLTAIYDTEKFGKVYFPSIRKRQDWGFMIRVLEKCNIAYGMKEPLAIYRMRTGSISSNKAVLVKYNIKFYHEVLHYGWLKSILKFMFLFMPVYIFKKTLQHLYNK